MKNFTIRRRWVSVLIALAVTVTFALSYASYADAASTYYLPTQIVNYKLVKGKWKKDSTHTYVYDSKGNITKWDDAKLKPFYKNGKLKKVTVTGKSSSGYTSGKKYKTVKEYNSKGRITSWFCEYPGTDLIGGESTFKYNKKGYISKRSNMTDPDTYSYSYYSNGLPSKITHNYVTYDKKGEYKTKTIEKYNKYGLATSGKSYRNGKLYSSWKEDITKKKGKVTTIVSTFKKNGKTEKWKVVYKYGKAKTKDRLNYVAIMGMTRDYVIFQSIGNNSAVGWCY